LQLENPLDPQTFMTMLKLLSAFHNISLYSRAMNFEDLSSAELGDHWEG
jgi:hypothetical protein